MKTVKFVKRGCDFFNDDDVNNYSDVGNYRIATESYAIKGKDGKTYFVECCRWKKYFFRTEHKKTGQQLKKAIREILNYNGLAIDIQYQVKESGGWLSTYGDSRLEAKIHEMNLSYTKSDILKAINVISVDQYDEIIIVDR